MLTSRQIKAVARTLRAAQQQITRPCFDCGGAPFGPEETGRICPSCHHYLLPYSPSEPYMGYRVHELIIEELSR